MNKINFIYSLIRRLMSNLNCLLDAVVVHCKFVCIVNTKYDKCFFFHSVYLYIYKRNLNIYIKLNGELFKMEGAIVHWHWRTLCMCTLNHSVFIVKHKQNGRILINIVIFWCGNFITSCDFFTSSMDHVYKMYSSAMTTF